MTTTPPQPPPHGPQFPPHDPPFPQNEYSPQNDQFPQNEQFPRYSDQPGQFAQPGPHDQHAPQGQFQQPGAFPQQGQQGQFAPQGQFPQQGQPFQGGAGFAAPPIGQGTLQCRFCGSVPAVKATVRGHQGMLIVMRFLKLEGPFCRTCGIATYRDMTAKSLWQGWWGIGSAIINPITMLINLPTRAKFGKLPEPVPGAPGQPMNPGKPLFMRPPILFLLLPIALIVLIVFAAQGDPEYASEGECIQNKGTVSAPDVRVVDCGSADAEYKIVGKLDNSTNSDECEQFTGYTVAYTEERGSSKYTLCLAPQK